MSQLRDSDRARLVERRRRGSGGRVEAHVNDAIGGLERVVAASERDAAEDLAATRRVNRVQAWFALAALLCRWASPRSSPAAWPPRRCGRSTG